MKLKIEDETEDYSDIFPMFSSGKRLKICSLKVESGHQDLSKQFMEIVFENARQEMVNGIYGTIAEKCQEKDKLIHFFHKYGFENYGIKVSNNLREEVLYTSINKFNIFPHK